MFRIGVISVDTKTRSAACMVAASMFLSAGCGDAGTVNHNADEGEKSAVVSDERNSKADKETNTDGEPVSVSSAAEVMRDFAEAWNESGEWSQYADGVVSTMVPSPLPLEASLYECPEQVNGSQIQCNFEVRGKPSYALLDADSMRITWIAERHAG